MKCTECQDIIHAYHGDELEEHLLTEAESHLTTCSACSREAVGLLASLSRLQQAFPDQRPPAGLWEKIEAEADMRDEV